MLRLRALLILACLLLASAAVAAEDANQDANIEVFLESIGGDPNSPVANPGQPGATVESIFVREDYRYKFSYRWDARDGVTAWHITEIAMTWLGEPLPPVRQ